MKILFNSAVSEIYKPERFDFVTSIFTDLANTFETLGHECLLILNRNAIHPNIYKNRIILEKYRRSLS